MIMKRIDPDMGRFFEYNIGWFDGRNNARAKYLLVYKLFHLEYFMGYDDGKRERDKESSFTKC